VTTPEDIQTLRVERAISLLRSLGLARYVQGPLEHSPGTNVRWFPDPEQIAESVAELERLQDTESSIQARLLKAYENHGISEAFAATAGAIEQAEDRVEAAEALLQAAEHALRRIKDNSEAWHGHEGLNTGSDRALHVISEWATAALAAAAAPFGRRSDNGESPADDPECGTDIGPFPTGETTE
jgi:hypothetical protein